MKSDQKNSEVTQNILSNIIRKKNPASAKIESESGIYNSYLILEVSTTVSIDYISFRDFSRL